MRRAGFWRLGGVLCGLALGGCRAQQPAPPSSPPPPAAAPIQFKDVTQAAGVNGTRINGAFGKKWFPETMGGGAFLDYDNDGWLDILIVRGDYWPGHVPANATRGALVLYHNNGNGTFTDVTRQSGLSVAFYGMGVAVGDYDNDGYDDLFITAVGQSKLFHNEPRKVALTPGPSPTLRERGEANSGLSLSFTLPQQLKGKDRPAPKSPLSRSVGEGPGVRVFREVTASSGIRDTGWSTSAAWVDYDNDGRLDLFVCHYVKWSPETDIYCGTTAKAYCRPTVYTGESCRLYHNEGGGRFTDATQQAGLLNANAHALGILVWDLDNDGRSDLIVANDMQPTFVYHNNGDGTFTDIGLSSGLAYDRSGHARAGMGIDAADYRNNGTLGIAIGDFSFQGLTFYEVAGPPPYLDRAQQAGLLAPSYPYVTFGLGFADFDNDGWPDLFVTNGDIEDTISRAFPSQSYPQPSLVLRNRGDGTFADVSAQAGPGVTQPLVGRGLCWGDYDNDGKVDALLIPNIGTPRLLHNETPTQNHWLIVKLVGAKSNRDGLGARVSVEAGGITQTGTARSGSSYLSASDLR
ncbi:MAG TPA: VCBS repeat-containing protein, partial [Chthonomonadaceae bacterium]|nr:VCBS repeat-containing protein [Chthonomonadaceae bacterium]